MITYRTFEQIWTNLDKIGIDTTHQVPAPQANSTTILITALTHILNIQLFGGHREFPKQNEKLGKTCPGNIGMELVKEIRQKNRFTRTGDSMKKWILAVPAMLATSLFIGYYDEAVEHDTQTHLFIKKHPTFQIEFSNIFANYRDDKTLIELTSEERRQVMDYCKYRLGIDTLLEPQDELDRCKR